MLTTEATQEMIADWKQIFESHRSSMLPNRKAGGELDNYFRNNYPYQLFENAEFKRIVALNITENEHSRNKLPHGMHPHINSYCVGNIFIGIDLCSGEFHVECEDIHKAIPIYDDLFVFRGLDEDDLNNYFLVAEYVKLTKTYNVV